MVEASLTLGSVIGEMAPARASIYAGTKVALNSITRVFAKELAPKKHTSQYGQTWCCLDGRFRISWLQRQPIRGPYGSEHAIGSPRHAQGHRGPDYVPCIGELQLDYRLIDRCRRRLEIVWPGVREEESDPGDAPGLFGRKAIHFL
jgi:hypothetical protein